MNFKSIIAKRRDGQTNSVEEFEFLCRGASNGSIPDYQLAAWLMAAYLRPLDDEETADLTVAMAQSGQRMDLSGLPKPWVDKHSTGGVGDKTTIVVLPMLAACGLTVVKMSGRGLGSTGGTIDKLQSIPGFRVDLSPEEMVDQASRIGIALTGQSPNLAPADGVLYALRDVTETTSSIPLLVSSILSKKIAGGSDTVVLDVKSGSGAFIKSEQGANELAEALIRTGSLCGLNIRAAITDMDQPLGATVGNALEIRESIEILTGKQSGVQSERFCRLCIELVAHTLEACGRSDDPVETATEVLASGRAADVASAWFNAQGASGNLESILKQLPTAEFTQTVMSDDSGWIARIDADAVGHAVVALGGGREKKSDKIDYAAGFEFHGFVGSKIEPGDPIFTTHASSSEALHVATDTVKAAISISPIPVPERSLILRML